MLAEAFTMTRQGVTKHLHVLAAAGAIDGTREGREHVWSLNPARLIEASTVSRADSAWVGRCVDAFEVARGGGLTEAPRCRLILSERQ